MNSFQKFFEKKSSSVKNSNFIISRDIKISYCQFEEQVSNISSYLKDKGIDEGNNIAVICDNNPDFILIVFSLWKLKAVPVPINIKLLNKEIEEQINFADCTFILVHKNKSVKLNRNSIKDRIITFPFNVESSKITQGKKFDENETALMLFTSGSSGKSKAVMLSFNNLIQSNMIGDQILKQNENDRWLASLPFYHIGGFSIVVRTFLSGASVIIPDSLKIQDLINAINEFKPTLASFVSTQLQRLIEKNITPDKELKNILIGGGFTSEELSLEAVKKGWKITKVYGSTEVSSFVSAITADEILKRPASSGKALYPNEILIVNETKEMVPATFRGEIIIKSSSVTKGYYKNPEGTNHKVINEFYYTGDIGYLDNAGYLFVEARREDLIISGGENIVPKEVESAILEHHSVNDCFVFGLDSIEWGQEAAAAVVLKKNEAINSTELKKFLTKKLAGYKIPRKFLFIDAIPKTSLGKVQKEKLLNLIRIQTNPIT
ncbi:MAG: o-succinylbenzoate--CoA ligase [Ignavibacteriaceae bacterium]